MIDTIIEGSFIFDGAGGPPIACDLAVTDDRIALIGDLSERDARERNGLGLNVATLIGLGTTRRGIRADRESRLDPKESDAVLSASFTCIGSNASARAFSGITAHDVG